MKKYARRDNGWEGSFIRNAGACLLLLLAFVVSTVQVSFAVADPCPQGMGHYWHLDETASPYADSKGSGTATCTNCPTQTTGVLNSAQQFAATTTQVNVASDTTFNWTQNDSFSVELWMQQSGANTCKSTELQVMAGRQSTGLSRMYVGCDGGKPAFFLRDNAGHSGELYGNKNLLDGKWHHFVAIKDGAAGQLRLYVDGVLQHSSSDVSTPVYTSDFSSTTNLNIGWLNTAGGYHFIGNLDEVSMYNRALSSDEIKQHYMDGTVGLGFGYCGCDKVANIMPLGDSITVGYISTLTDSQMVGYRQPLYFDLRNAGYDSFHFVGSRENGQATPPPFDYNHEGYGGQPTSYVNSNITNWLTNSATAGKPVDAILLHIGTVDFISNTQSAATTAATNVGAILDKIKLYDKNIPVLLAKIINRYDANNVPFSYVTTYNTAIETMANTRIANGDRIIIVDQNSALTDKSTDYSDDKHPSPTGYNKMAGVWFQALRSFMPVCVNSVPSMYTILSTAGTGGSISPSGSVTVNSGAVQTFTITPNAGYHLQSLTDNSVDVTGAVANGEYTISNITTDHTVVATFTINTYTISATANAGGSISPSGSVTANYGDSQTFTIMPNFGYRIEDVKVDGKSVGGISTYTFNAVTANHTIKVTFKRLPRIKATAGKGGSISPTGSVTVNYGASQTFTITPDVGYRIEDVKVDKKSVGKIGTYTFRVVTKKHTIKATFKEDRR